MRALLASAILVSSLLPPLDAGSEGSGTLVLQPLTDGVLSIDVKRKIQVTKGQPQDVVVEAGVHMLSFEDSNGAPLWTRVVRVSPSERMALEVGRSITDATSRSARRLSPDLVKSLEGAWSAQVKEKGSVGDCAIGNSDMWSFFLAKEFSDANAVQPADLYLMHNHVLDFENVTPRQLSGCIESTKPNAMYHVAYELRIQAGEGSGVDATARYKGCEFGDCPASAKTDLAGTMRLDGDTLKLTLRDGRTISFQRQHVDKNK